MTISVGESGVYKPEGGAKISIADSGKYSVTNSDLCIENSGTLDGFTGVPEGILIFAPPERSEWKCYMFGGEGDGFTWTPLKGKEPNWFWRWMQFLCLGNRWVKTPD